MARKLTIFDRLRSMETGGQSLSDLIIRAADTGNALVEALQQFVNGVDTHMIDSPADDILHNVTNRARAALDAAYRTNGDTPDNGRRAA